MLRNQFGGCTRQIRHEVIVARRFCSRLAGRATRTCRRLPSMATRRSPLSAATPATPRRRYLRACTRSAALRLSRASRTRARDRREDADRLHLPLRTQRLRSRKARRPATKVGVMPRAWHPSRSATGSRSSTRTSWSFQPRSPTARRRRVATATASAAVQASESSSSALAWKVLEKAPSYITRDGP